MKITKATLWKLYTDKNPHWLTDGVELTPDGIRRLFDQTFDLAHKAGLESGKSKEKVS